MALLLKLHSTMLLNKKMKTEFQKLKEDINKREKGKFNFITNIFIKSSKLLNNIKFIFSASLKTCFANILLGCTNKIYRITPQI